MLLTTVDGERLASAEVTVDRNRRWLERTGFYRRMESGVGYFMTRDEIEQRNPRVLSDLMRPIPDVRVVSRGTRGTFIAQYGANPCGTILVWLRRCPPARRRRW
ncbi:MAG: hypothetical protein ACOC8B_08100 [Gemmatimonadota bacterium]